MAFSFGDCSVKEISEQTTYTFTDLLREFRWNDDSKVRIAKGEKGVSYGLTKEGHMAYGGKMVMGNLGIDGKLAATAEGALFFPGTKIYYECLNPPR